MKPSTFPKVNDIMLAEALRQLIPVAEAGVRATKGQGVRPYRRAEEVLDMWVRQERGRKKKVDGPLPKVPVFDPAELVCAGPDEADPGQSVPVECRRPKRPRKAAGFGSDRRSKFSLDIQ